jgi:acyl-CoA reductase-like NAD-dependent aldehyde dehydrogenase
VADRADARRDGAATRLDVRKTYKLYIGGAFPRSESGRSYAAAGRDGTVLARPARASRKDVRDAVRAARSALKGWASATAYNRGQVLYRVAELMEGRRPQFVQQLYDAGVRTRRQAEREVAASIDRWVWYAGWSDKIGSVLGGANPVAGPYFNFTVPEPTGVVGIAAPEEPALLGLVSLVAPAIVSGNATVVLASEERPLPAVTLTEVLATSDVPGGVINLLTGFKRELLPWLVGHMDVNAVDLTGAPAKMVPELEVLSSENVKRTVRAAGAETDWFGPAAQSPYAVTALMEMKTVWHPMGA